MATRVICAAMVLGAVLFAGCQSDTGTFQTTRLPVSNYDQAFDVVRTVLAEQFSIDKADRASGKIVTAPQAVTDTSDLTLASSPRGVRRVATAQVKRSGSTTLVSLKVSMQKAYAVQPVPRPTYNEYNPTVTGSEADLYVRPEARSGVMWQDAGSDATMERKILAEIESRLKSAGVDMQKPVEAPETAPEEKGVEK